MWRGLPLVLVCTLTQPVVFTDIQTDKAVPFEVGRRIQIIHIKGDETIVCVNNNYYVVKSDKLVCR